MSGHNCHSKCCCCEHGPEDRELNDSERGDLYNLYLKIDLLKVQCLNESIDGSGKNVFKPWDKRHDKEKYVESDADPELLFNIPFTGNVKLKGIIIIGGEDNQHPSSLKLYKNRENMTFDDTNGECDQEFELTHDLNGVIEYPVKVTRFNSLSHLSIFFPKNFGAEISKVYYIGLRGDFFQAQRQEVVITTYEARANPTDHKINSLQSATREVQ